ncbi:MAG: dihydroxy-acid dehydratase, partial [Chloroflexota bacterium]|nr:dihydroxy-acid dehydratase [Chloroflexota bacterium]
VFYTSDICDGVAQAHAGMSYSLVSRDVQAAMIEIHALGHPHDGIVLVSGNDKSVPAHLMAIARCDLPAIHVPGGTQLNAPHYSTSDLLWGMGAAVERGELPQAELEKHQRGACPTCGACQFMGSASTGQVLSEALGLALPGSALIPAPLTRHLRVARAAGKQILKLVEQDLRPSKILTREAFENAITLHAAVGGSTNSLLHLPAIAREVGIDITIDDFDRIHRRVPVLANAKTTGQYPVEYLWYAGGVPAVMLEVQDLLHLDCLTVTGQTIGENLAQIERSTFFFETRGFLANVKVTVEEVIRPRSDPFGPEGGVAVLRGNLAPGGAVIKHFSVPREMHVHVGPARVFDTEDRAVEALINRDVKPGDVVIIRYEGPRANGMPEMYYATAIIAASKELSATCAVVTDGRYSGAAKGPAVGHVTPETLDGGPIALVEDGDLIEIHVPERRLAIVGTSAGRLSPTAVDGLLADRRARWTRPKSRHERGILSLYARVAGSPAEGAYLA